MQAGVTPLHQPGLGEAPHHPLQGGQRHGDGAEFMRSFTRKTYNVLAGAVILWTAAATGLGGAALSSAGLFHAAIGSMFVYALAAGRRG